MERLLVLAAGAGTGALFGLLVATLWNQNCDSILEAAQGCTRLYQGHAMEYGALIGVPVAFLIVGVIQRLRQPRDVNHDRTQR